MMTDEDGVVPPKTEQKREGVIRYGLSCLLYSA